MSLLQQLNILRNYRKRSVAAHTIFLACPECVGNGEGKRYSKSNGRTARKKESGRHYRDSNQFNWTVNERFVPRPTGQLVVVSYEQGKKLCLSTRFVLKYQVDRVEESKILIKTNIVEDNRHIAE